MVGTLLGGCFFRGSVVGDVLYLGNDVGNFLLVADGNAGGVGTNMTITPLTPRLVTVYLNLEGDAALFSSAVQRSGSSDSSPSSGQPLAFRPPLSQTLALLHSPAFAALALTCLLVAVGPQPIAKLSSRNLRASLIAISLLVHAFRYTKLRRCGWTDSLPTNALAGHKLQFASMGNGGLQLSADDMR